MFCLSSRSLPDWRGDWCRNNYDLEVHRDRAKDLPDVSVIICFHNEAWSTLLRSGRLNGSVTISVAIFA